MGIEISEDQQNADYKNEELTFDDASFRDPSGNVLHYKNEIYRIINNNYKNIYFNNRKKIEAQSLI